MKGIFADEPTMFADYRCLQIFIDYKVLCYSEKLEERFKTNGKSFSFSQTVNFSSLIKQDPILQT